MRRLTLIAIAVLLLAASGETLCAADRFAGQNIDELKKLILPKPDEMKWLSIPWETDLWAARQKAAKEGKPILLWEMDGNPMGCT